MKTMDSFLKNYIAGNPIGISLDDFLLHNPNHQLAKAMKALHQANSDGIYFNDAIELVKEIEYKNYEVEEQLVFLQLLAHAYAFNNRIENANSILSIIKRLITPQLAPEWQIIPLDVESAICYFKSNFKKQLENLELGMQILENKSGRFKVVFRAYLIFLISTHNNDLFEKKLAVFKTLGNDDFWQQNINFMLMLKSVEDANFSIIDSLLQKVKKCKSFLFMGGALSYCENMFQIFIHNNNNDLNETKEYHWELISLYNLNNKKYSEALHWAHKAAEINLDYKSKPTLSSYGLIRAELANGNINAAVHSLNKRKEIENNSIFDDFFWFRIYNIKKDYDMAQYYFNIFCKNIKKENLDHRFDLELKLSPEISFSTIRQYSENKNNLNQPQKAPIFQKEKLNSQNSLEFIVGNSPPILQVKELIRKFAVVDTSVLIYGETGTGKELIAKALWQTGPYQNKPFIPINCGAISEHLLQSELFGHKKGAFTGAFSDHQGIFEAAGDGIVFMDEIGEINSNMQINLLRILEAKEFRPVGSNTTKQLKCKIVAATNKKLETLVKEGSFRKDLQYRLERLIIEIPPLRDRPTDIPALVEYFLNDQNPNLPKISFENQSLAYICSLKWEGNIRELRNEMDRIRLFYSDKQTLTIAELSDKYKPTITLPEKIVISNVTTETPTLNMKSKFRKLEELRALFQKCSQLSRTDVACSLHISTNTAASYLMFLESSKFIIKIQDSKSVKTFYYKLNDSINVNINKEQI
jgi:transcriptional regulator with PAS, ATPase and Fis domain